MKFIAASDPFDCDRFGMTRLSNSAPMVQTAMQRSRVVYFLDEATCPQSESILLRENYTAKQFEFQVVW